jgi:hypothetical protein
MVWPNVEICNNAPAALTLRKEPPPPSVNFVGGWVGPKASLDTTEKKKSLAPAGNRSPAVQPMAHRYTNSAGPAFII